MLASLGEIKKRAKKIKLVAMDVDGVLTNGDIVVLESGEEVKNWSSKDRLLMALIRSKKIPLTIAWITGRQSKAVEWGAKDLSIPYLVQKCGQKKEALETILKKEKITPQETVFIGDDIIDLPALKLAGLSACPKDAVPEVLKTCDYVSPLEGGKGVVRDVLEIILKAQNKWDDILNSFSH
ncbi:MAG: KdsC family phosphatase [Elusimicrobiota bacterium]